MTEELKYAIESQIIPRSSNSESPTRTPNNKLRSKTFAKGIVVKTNPLTNTFVAAIVLGACFHPQFATAELTLASPFTDNAVLQRGVAVPIWGKADPGAEIAVSFAGQEHKVVAGSGGRWQVSLAPLQGSAEPRVLTVRSSTESHEVAIKNIVIGEVWICSGQSNMQMRVDQVPKVKELVSSATNLRSFSVKRNVAFAPQDSCEGRWVEHHPNSAVAFAFAYYLEKAADVPIGIILTCWGSSSIEAWMPRDMTETVPHFKTMMNEFDADAETRDRITSILEGKKPWSGRDDIFLRRQSNILYNAMIHPLIPYACRGLVWYQGERNTQSMQGMVEKPWYSRNSGMLKYGATLKQWVQRYRKGWGNDKLHFMIVMLPGFHKPLKTGPKKGAEHPAVHSWAWMRQSQLEVLDLPGTSVVNTIDLGDAKNVHPKDKLPVGKRIALLATSETLGQDVPAHGPKFRKIEAQENQLIVHFDHAEGLTTSDNQPPTGFWLADESAQWVRADAKLDGSSVILKTNKLTRPIYVRYAFAGKPTVNLINHAGLPAFPFRTDTFEP